MVPFIPTMKSRVTQSDVARAAGVHNTTVSLALRNSPALPEATRKRIQLVAAEMGYAPDPALQALVAYRNGRMPNRRQDTLAYVTGWSTRWGWQHEPAHAKCYAGAQRKAAECGFQLEHFWLAEPGMTQRRLNSMLFNRGVTGLLLASHLPDAEPLTDLDWSRLTAVKLGCFPLSPPLHRVMDDHTGTMRQAVRRLQALGYERIGVALPQAWDEFSDQAWSAGFLAEQGRRPHHQRVPLLRYGPPANPADAPGESSALPRSALETWLLQYEPEVVIGFGSPVRTLLETMEREVAYVDLFLEETGLPVAGMRENCERVGEVATEMLVAHLQQNLRGIPTAATTTVVEGTWQDGASLPTLRADPTWTRSAAFRPGDHDQILLAAP